MDRVKCPTCGTSNSSKRQICHLCGQLLGASNVGIEEKEPLEIMSEDLKRAAEDAIKEAGRSSRAGLREPEDSIGSKSEGTSVDKPRKSRQTRPTKRGKTKRERLIIAVAAVVTILALGTLVYRYAIPKHPQRPTASVPAGSINIEPPSDSYASGIYPEIPIVIPQTIKPVALSLSAPQDTETTEPEKKPVDYNAIAKSAAKSASETLVSVLERIGTQIGAELTIDKENFRGTVSQQGIDTMIVLVSFSETNFSGSVNLLVRRDVEGWETGWKITNYSDLQISFMPMLTVESEDGTSEDRISAITAGEGSFKPFEQLADEPIRVIYG